jgi:peptide/nickel transport system permease protein
VKGRSAIGGRAGRTPSLSPYASIVARVAESLAVVWLLASLVFFALRVLPGDPATLILGDDASPAELARLRTALHMDRPLVAQYGEFLRGLATLDLGDSIRRPGVKAMERVLTSLGPTSALAGVAVAIGAVLGIAAALLAAGPWLSPRGKRGVERALVATSAVPLLAFAPVLTYALAARARVIPLPGDPDAGAAGLLFASTLLSIPLAAHVGRVARASLADVEGAPFLVVARAKGAGSVRVWVRHALPAVSGPILTVVATQLGALLGGAVVLERLFERAGLGTLILDAYQTRDLPVLEGAVVAAGGLFVITQAAAAAIHAAIDPRVRA